MQISRTRTIDPREEHPNLVEVTGMSRVVDIADLIDESGVSGLQKRVFVLCWTASLLDGYDTQALGVAVPRMHKVRYCYFGPRYAVPPRYQQRCGQRF